MLMMKRIIAAVFVPVILWSMAASSYAADLTAAQISLLENGTAEQVKEALEAGTLSVDDRNWKGETALMVAVRKNHEPEVINELLKAGADTSACDKAGNMVLMSYARRKIPIPQNDSEGFDKALENEYMILFYLVFNGAKLSSADKDGNTALALIVKDGDEKQIWNFMALLILGSDPDAKNKQGFSARDYACMPGKKPFRNAIDFYEGEFINENRIILFSIQKFLKVKNWDFDTPSFGFEWPSFNFSFPSVDLGVSEAFVECKEYLFKALEYLRDHLVITIGPAGVIIRMRG